MKFSKSKAQNLVWSLSACLMATGVWGFKPPQDFENTKVLRSIDLTGSYVKESVLLDVKNIGSAPVQSYYYAVPEGLEKHIAVIEAREDKGGVAAVTLELLDERDEET